ncbi:MAG: hypothetical protein KDB53_12185 [Planctomycetes bacterium]|nr:hypothetical protein [Planctomycetota bacterium]
MEIDAQTDAQIREKLAELEEDYPEDDAASLYAAVAEYFDLAGDLERALAAQRQAAVLEPDSATQLFLHARALLKLGRWRDGGKILETCSDIDSVALAGRHWANNNLYYIAYALFNVGRYKEAAEGFRGAQNLINIWTDPLVLKRFHLHQGWSWHLDGNYLEASECYKRALIAPGPGDSCDEDDMDPDVVEDAQDFNDQIEPFLERSLRLEGLKPEGLIALPAFP